MPDTQPIRVRFGVFELDLRAGELCLGELKIVLQDQPFQILQMLVKRAGEVITRDEIQKQLWPDDTIVAFDIGINQAIRRLRRALNDSAEKPGYIETVARRGYRLKVPVEAVDKPPDCVLLTGKQVSHYRVLEVIGGGGMGVVYRAEDLKLGRAVALKFLPVEVGNDSRARERFQREARAASALDHPNICSIYELEEYDGKPFIVMQLLEGQTVRDWLASASKEEMALALKHLLDIASQVAEGLQAAHDKGIIHRDIKPANIFITNKGVAKILDFGLAKLVEVGEEEEEAEADRGAEDVTGAFAVAEIAVEKEDQAEGVPAKAVAAEASASAMVLPSPSPRRLWPWNRKGRKFEGARPIEGFKAADFSNDGSPANGSSSIGFTTAVANAGDGGTGLHLTRTGFAFGTAAYMSPEQIRGDKLDARTDIFSFGLVLYEMVTGQRAFSGKTAAVVQSRILAAEPVALHDVNHSVPSGLETIVRKALEKDREKRYQSVAEMRADLTSLQADLQETSTRRPLLRIATLLLLIALIFGAVLYLRTHRRTQLAETDQIVLADFTNNTGDPLFDGTLKQALSLHLQQSPFLNLVSDQKVNETLKLMDRAPGQRLTETTAKEVCLRTHSKATLAGSISSRGERYRIEMKVLDCQTGDTLTSAAAEAENRNEVLSTVGELGNQLRRRMGESLASVEKYNQPLEEATTSSLEALQAFTQAQTKEAQQGIAAALPYYKLAVELDPTFGYAWAQLGTAYMGVYDDAAATESVKKAFELRDRVSQRERFFIEGQYYDYVTGDLDKFVETYSHWTQEYPREYMPHMRLSSSYRAQGKLEEALAEAKAAREIAPDNVAPATSLMLAYFRLNRFKEAKAVYDETRARKLDGATLRLVRCWVAFFEDDVAREYRNSWGRLWKQARSGVTKCYSPPTTPQATAIICKQRATGLYQAVASSPTRRRAGTERRYGETFQAQREVSWVTRARPLADVEQGLGPKHGRAM